MNTDIEGKRDRATSLDGASEGTFSIVGNVETPTQQWFIDGLRQYMVSVGHDFHREPIPNIRLVLNVVDPSNPQPFRRKAQATFVVAIVQLKERPNEVIQSGYPYLLHSLANLTILLLPANQAIEAHFITLEQGHYTVTLKPDDDSQFFEEVYARLAPLASSHLVINNVYKTDLEEGLWNGDRLTEQLKVAGRKLAEMNLLPAPFPIEQLLSDRDLRHVKRLYDIGGLSYGNLSVRLDSTRYWMSASGVDKGKLEVVGRDILLVSGFDPTIPAMILSVLPTVEPRRVSVDAIEHWIIYQEHPQIGAIVHVHAWMDNIRSTEVNYPCGTIELAEAVAELIRQEPDPTHAVIGLKNHGVTITGPTMENILQRIEGKIIPQVPMS